MGQDYSRTLPCLPFVYGGILHVGLVHVTRSRILLCSGTVCLDQYLQAKEESNRC
jgi:hypothetical protein